MVLLEKYSNLFNLSRLAAKAEGIDSINPNFKITLKTVGVISCVVVYFPCILYILYTQISEEWYVILNTLCLVASALQDSVNLFVYVTQKNKFRRLYDILADTYGRFQQRESSYIEILHKMSIRIGYFVKISGIGYLTLTVMCCLLLVPFVYPLVTGKKALIMQLIIPSLNPQPTLGFLGTALIIIYGGMSMLPSDTKFLVFILHTRLFANLLKARFKDFTKILNKNEVGKATAFLMVHQLYCRYIQEIKNLYLGLCFTVLLIYRALGTTVEINV